MNLTSETCGHAKSKGRGESMDIHPWACWRRAVSVGVLSFTLAAALAVAVIAYNGWHPSALAGFGENSTAHTEFAEGLVGPVVVRPHQGHDGKYFFVQALDPFLLDAPRLVELLHGPAYRAQRMLYPLLAGVGGLMPAEGILWMMAAINLIAIGLGGALLARIAMSYGLSPWLGLAFVLNPGVLFEAFVGGAGVLSFALVLGAVERLMASRPATGIGLLVLSCLTREVMLISALGLAIWLWREGRSRQAIWTLGVPIAAVAAWAVYVRLALGLSQGPDVHVIAMLGSGVAAALEGWLDRPLDLFIGAVSALLSLGILGQFAQGRRDPLGFASFGYAVLVFFLVPAVWYSGFDVARAVTPVLSAVVVSPSLARGEVD